MQLVSISEIIQFLETEVSSKNEMREYKMKCESRVCLYSHCRNPEEVTLLGDASVHIAACDWLHFGVSGVLSRILFVN